MGKDTKSIGWKVFGEQDIHLASKKHLMYYLLRILGNSTLIRERCNKYTHSYTYRHKYISFLKSICFSATCFSWEVIPERISKSTSISISNLQSLSFSVTRHAVVVSMMWLSQLIPPLRYIFFFPSNLRPVWTAVWNKHPFPCAGPLCQWN